MVQYLANAEKAGSLANPPAAAKFVTCYFEEKISLSGGTYTLCAKGKDYRFRVRTGTTASVGIAANSPDFHAAHFSAVRGNAGRPKTTGLAAPPASR
jgi:hypothetical protein